MAETDQDLARLLERYFEGTQSAEECARLEQRLRADPAARQAYWEMAEWHATLSAWGEHHAGREEAKRVEFPVEGGLENCGRGDLTALLGSSECDALRGEVTPPTSGQPKSQTMFRLLASARGRRWLPVAMAAAALVVAAFVVVRFARSAFEGSLAEVSFQRDTDLPRRLGAAEYTIAVGAVRFETAAGASVSVAGPARFRLTAADRIELSRGQLTARMMRPEARLTVKVRDLEVTDLGTAFGIDANVGGRALVSVFDGSVAVKTPAAAEELHLNRGESLVHRGEGAPEMARTGYDALAFRELWPLTAGIDEASTLVEFLPPGPLLRPLREYRANDHVFLFPERQTAEVREALALDLSPDVHTWPESATSPYPLARGERAHSYLVFFQPDPASTSSGFRRLTGEITFQHRVIGVICSDQGLDASDGVLGAAGADYSTPGQRRGLEEADKENVGGSTLQRDRIRIGADGRTVHFDFHVSNEREQMRVLVAPE